MCPAATTKMKKLQDLVTKTGVPFVKFLSITLDPEFDSPGVLKSYARAYNLDEKTFKLALQESLLLMIWSINSAS